MDTQMNPMEHTEPRTMMGDSEVVWHDVRQAPFSLHGLYEPETTPFFHRLPLDVAEATSEGVNRLSRESAGGRVRFSTNSPYIAIRATFLEVDRCRDLTFILSAGFDLYIDGEFGSRFVKEYRTPYDLVDFYQEILYVDGEVMRSYTINFPVHSVVKTLEVGLKPGAQIAEARPYRDIKPVLFYGSSIVHGTAASRPGNIYPAIISRELNVDFRNIGFSSMAKGEPVLARWMATLPMSVFVCDYDHNAPSLKHLEDTHYALYETIREKNPDVPYIMVTRPDYWTFPREQEYIRKRHDLIMTSYLKARATGDQNVYFVDGMSFNVAPHQYEMSADGLHPNDAGFIRMADSIGTFVRHVLEKGT